ncbi:MAG TPA: hypothetical protein VF980_12905 [Thermoanaerobaculia bacterium]
MPPLSEWETFYVIVGSSAAALTGLQFVVVALGADAHSLGGEAEIKAFGTPTIVHFCAVLTIAAVIAVPHQSSGSLSFCLTALGLAGVLYAAVTAGRARRQTGYAPVFEDWLFHAGLPMLAYATLLVTGIATYKHAAGALYATAATALILLFVGIHNAWDAAVFISMRKRVRDRASQPEE